MSYGSLGAWYAAPTTAVMLSKIAATAVKSGPTPSAAQIAEMAARNMVWVPASTTARGHWETKRSTDPNRPRVTVKRTLAKDMTPAQLAARKKMFAGLLLRKKCQATGMPAGVVADCVEGLQAGVSMDKVLSTLQEQAGAAEAAAAAASVAPVAAQLAPAVAVAVAKPKSRLLLYGGIAAVGAVGLFLVLRKKKR